METQKLNVIEPATGRVLGTIEVNISRADRLLHGGRFYGWRAWEVFGAKERAEFGLAQEDAVRFNRAS